MEYCLDRSLFVKHLKNANTVSSITEQLEQYSEGVKYLYSSVVQPILNGYDVDTTSLEMEKFDLEDLAELERYISATGERDQAFLYRMYSCLQQANPIASAVSFL